MITKTSGIARRFVVWTLVTITSASAAFLTQWEGQVNETYIDMVGVATACIGHTGKFVVPGKKYTDQECLEILQYDIQKHYSEMNRCVHQPLTLNQTVAVLSMFFNMGGRMCSSTMVRMINEGQPPEVWCEQIPRWNRAGGQVVRGLVLRREQERDICLGKGRWMPEILKNVPRGTTLKSFTVE